jgi:hypothetical protein
LEGSGEFGTPHTDDTVAWPSRYPTLVTYGTGIITTDPRGSLLVFCSKWCLSVEALKHCIVATVDTAALNVFQSKPKFEIGKARLPFSGTSVSRLCRHLNWLTAATFATQLASRNKYRGNVGCT